MSMVAGLVSYSVTSAHAEELHRRVRERIVSAAQRIAGYRGFLLLDCGDDKRLAVMLFESVEAARAAREVLTPIGEQHIAALMSEPATHSFGIAVIRDGIFVTDDQAIQPDVVSDSKL